MNLDQFNRILRQALLLPVVALLLAAGALYLQIRSANDTVSMIQVADARIAQASLVAKLIADEESGLRGYETTGDERFLQSFTEAGDQLSAEFSKLEDLTEGDADQKYNLEDLRNEHQTWRDAFALPIVALVRAGGQTSDVNLNLYGKSLMDQVRHDLEAIMQRAGSRRAMRITQWRSQVHSMLVALIAIALGMGVLIGLFMRNRLQAVSAAYRSSLEILSKRAEEIYQSEQRLRTMLDAIADGVITCDATSRIEMMNPVASKLTGWQQHEAAGHTLEEVLSLIDEHSRQTIETPAAKVRRLNAGVGSGSNTVLVRKDGTQILIADSGAPVRDHSGSMVGIVVVFRDVTMERRTQEALLASEKLAVAGRLAATIAHEIHNPLDSVSNLLYLMKNGAKPEEFEQFIDMAERELARVTQISRSMLGLYRESRAPVPVDLREILEDILTLMEHRFHEVGATVHLELTSSIIVDAFPAELRQVFTNLISNAVEASPRGGEVRISAMATPSGIDGVGQKKPAGAVIFIRDQGDGIPEEIKPNLFQPFFTTKGEQGTGLGLWVSRGIIHKHGGSIELSSNGERSGTVVRVFLAEKPTISTHIT